MISTYDYSLSEFEIYLNKLLDRLINPNTVNEATNDKNVDYSANLEGARLLLQIRNIIFIQLLIVFVLLLAFIRDIITKDYLMSITPIFYIVIICVPTIYYIRFKDKPNIRFISNYCMIGMIVGITMLNMMSGGIERSSQHAIYVPVLAAFTICRLKEAIIYCALCVIQLIYIYILRKLDFQFPAAEDESVNHTFVSILFNFILFIVCLYRYVVSYQFYMASTRRLIDILSQQKLEAQQAQQHMTEYISRMSHEFRSPLHVILNLNEFAIAEKHQPKQVEEHLNNSNAVIKTLCVLVNDVLTYARSQHIGIELKNEIVNIPKLINHLTNIVSIDVKNDISIVSEICNNIEHVLCDETRILQILLNLVSNAKKFTEKGEIMLRVTIMNVKEWHAMQRNEKNSVHKNYWSLDTKSNINNELLCFQVIDTGIGIDHDKLSKVLIPFVQADSSIIRRFGGTGLGLSIVQQIVKAMHGYMYVESHINKGSTFSIAIPYVAIENTSTINDKRNILDNDKLLSTNVISKKDRTSAKLLESLHVLVVDDNEFILRIACRLLETIGVQNIYYTSKANEVIELIKKNPIDIALIDLHMPEKSGYDCASEIRMYEDNQHQYNHWIKLVAFTADVNPEIDQKCRSCGFNSILLKPANTNNLKTLFEKSLPKIESKNAWTECVNIIN